NGGTSECSTSVTTSDTQPPMVTCSSTPLNGHRVLIEYSAEDVCGNAVGSAVIETLCCPLPVTNGQVVKLKCAQQQECKLKLDFEEGIFEIESDSATLMVTATDECGNEATCTVELCIPDDGDDGDSDSDDNDSDSDDEGDDDED
ncbi:MAG: hypothetical protein ACE5FA_14980, partial [Dehalococcoidia bacterium]